MTINLESVGSGFAAPISVNGGGGTETLVGPSATSTFNVTGTYSGTLTVTGDTSFTSQPVTFTGIQNLTGGSALDTFNVASGATFTDGTIAGGGNSQDSVTIDLGPSVGPLTVTEPTDSSATLNVVSTSGDTLTKSTTQVTSSSFPSSTITYSGFATVNTEVPSGLYADILNLLGSGFSTSETLPAEDLDGILDLSAVTLNFSTASSGTVSISTGPATLFPGTSHSASITSVTGSYTVGTATFALTLNGINLNAAGLLTASISSISFQDDENNTLASDVLATVQSADITLPPLDNTQITLDGTASNPALTITRGGFTLSNASVTLPSLTWQGVFELTSPTIQFTNVTYTKAGDTFTGTVGISANTIALFPGQTGFSSTVTGFSGTYTFGSGGGSVDLTAASVGVNLGGTAELNASNVVFTLDPSQGVFSMTTGFSTLAINGAGGQPVVDLSGDFALSTGTSFGATIVGTGAPSSPEAVTAIELGGTNIEGFFGVGGGNYWQSNGQPNPSITNAYGLAFSNLSFGLAILTPTSASMDSNVYYALQATVGQVESVLPGSVPVSVQLGQPGTPLNLEIDTAYNPNSTTRGPPVLGVNFTQLPYEPNNPGLSIPTGTGTAPVLINLNAPIFELTGSMIIAFGGFAQFSGTFAIQQIDLQNVPLTGGGTVSDATALTIGVSSGSAFLGLNGGTPQAAGLSVSITSLAIALIKPSASSDTRSWLAVSATVGSISVTGIPDLTVMGTAIQVSVNSAASDGTAVNFGGIGSGANMGLSVPTGPSSSVPLTYSSEINLAASGTLSLGLQASGVSAALGGTFAFQSESVTLGTNTTPSTVIQVGVQDASTSLSLGSSAPGVTISNINGAFLIESTGVAGVLSAGSITFSGLPSVLSVGSITNGLFQINTTGAAASATVLGTSFDYSASDQFDFMSVSGTISSLNIDNIISGSATVAVGESTVDVSLGGTTTLTGATLFTLSLSNFQVSAGASGFGISVSGGDLGIAVLQPPAATNDTRYWLAVVANGLAGSLDLGGAVSASVQNGSVTINLAGGQDPSGNAATPLNWKSAISENGGANLAQSSISAQHRAGGLGVAALDHDRRRDDCQRHARRSQHLQCD